VTALVIDDDDDIRLVVKMSLRLIGGLDVIEASSGQEGVDLAMRVRPDIIMLDVMMPGMDGPTVLHQLYNNPLTSGIPVIFLTAKAMPGEIGRLKDLGAVGVLTKPFDPMQLAADVQALLPASR
jgi:two-component system, OmpR family, response regulator